MVISISNRSIYSNTATPCNQVIQNYTVAFSLDVGFLLLWWLSEASQIQHWHGRFWSMVGLLSPVCLSSLFLPLLVLSPRIYEEWDHPIYIKQGCKWNDPIYIKQQYQNSSSVRVLLTYTQFPNSYLS